DTRITDRLDPSDIHDLRDAIEANGQTVPILVRRHPSQEDRYLLVYGRRRLEAIRQSDKVTKVRALVASLDDEAATRAQISENMARRDLSYIEKALFARELIDQGFGTQSHVAEVLTVTKSAISMALTVVEMVSPDLARAIGPAQGIGRPRWDLLAKNIEASGTDPAHLVSLALATRESAEDALATGQEVTADPSIAAFEAVLAKVKQPETGAKPKTKKDKPKIRSLHVDGQHLGTLRKSGKSLRLEIEEGGFAQWLELRADMILEELHDRWKQRGEE
ncbi:MAG: plasmid partitioning protein RepB, partial [Mangrovicoccus sp.]